jgi:hypothetical protein
MPEIYANDLAAIAEGYPALLHYDPDQDSQDLRRRQACTKARKAEAGIKSPMTCDEYPFASTREGGFYNGRYSRIAAAPQSEQSTQGGELRVFIRQNHLTAGSPFLAEPDPR